MTGKGDYNNDGKPDLLASRPRRRS
ncbi:hypothetical protein ACWDSD_40255 [Streptomyces spiralis]